MGRSVETSTTHLLERIIGDGVDSPSNEREEGNNELILHCFFTLTRLTIHEHSSQLVEPSPPALHGRVEGGDWTEYEEDWLETPRSRLRDISRCSASRLLNAHD